MQLKTAIDQFLDSKSMLSSYATYKSCSRYLQVTVNLKTLDMAGDLLTSERKKRIKKTKEVFEKVEHKLRKKSQNTKYFTINMLKSILKLVEDQDGSRFWTAFNVDKEEKDIVILDTEFAKAFVNDDHELYDTLSDKLQAIWEMSAVMLTTCLRFSDAQTLKEEDFNADRITVKNQKTGTVTSCPIPASLAEKLTVNLLNHGKLYTTELSKDSCYRALPRLLEMYPEMEKKTDLKFHVFRKTAISLMLAMKVPQTIVMRASGHSIGSKAFARYVGHVETMFNQEINSFQSKFYG